MGVVQVALLVLLALVIVQALPNPKSVEEIEKPATILKPQADQPDSTSSTDENVKVENVPRRVAREANPQNGHFVNYIRADDRFPTLA